MWSRDKLMEGGYRCLLTWWSRTHLEGAHIKTGALSQILQRQLIDLTRKLFDVPKQVQWIKNKSSIGIWQVDWWLVPCFQMRSVWPMWPPRPLPRVPGCLVMVIDCHLSCGLDSSWHFVVFMSFIFRQLTEPNERQVLDEEALASPFKSQRFYYIIINRNTLSHWRPW